MAVHAGFEVDLQTLGVVRDQRVLEGVVLHDQDDLGLLRIVRGMLAGVESQLLDLRTERLHEVELVLGVSVLLGQALEGLVLVHDVEVRVEFLRVHVGVLLERQGQIVPVVGNALFECLPDLDVLVQVTLNLRGSLELDAVRFGALFEVHTVGEAHLVSLLNWDLDLPGRLEHLPDGQVFGGPATLHLVFVQLPADLRLALILVLITEARGFSQAIERVCTICAIHIISVEVEGSIIFSILFKFELVIIQTVAAIPMLTVMILVPIIRLVNLNSHINTLRHNYNLRWIDSLFDHLCAFSSFRNLLSLPLRRLSSKSHNSHRKRAWATFIRLASRQISSRHTRSLRCSC